MGNKEKCMAILECLDDAQLECAVTMLQTLKHEIDEAADDAFCLRMIQEFDNDPDPNKYDSITIEEAAKEMGIELHEI